MDKQNYFTYIDNTSDDTDKTMKNLYKQIMIDGVDVSGCCQYMPRYMEDYDIDTLDYCGYHFKPCKDVDVKYCYYKQLKRKEQECAKWKHQAELGSETTDRLAKELEEKEKELEEIRGELYVTEESLKDYKAHYNRQCEQVEKLKAENDALKNNDVFSIRLFKDKADKYEQALKEIKEIVEIENNDIKVLYDRRTHQRMKQILEKISEVINE